MRQAILEAMADELRRDDGVILFGEDVAEAGGPFKTSVGFLDEFGPSRVRDTPISEMGFLGAALGAATTGLRPIVEIMFVEFLGVALDQLVTQAAKFRYLSKGRLHAPMTVRASTGAGLGMGCQHSQCLESWLLATPGLKVVAVSGPSNAYGLLRSAIQHDDPVVVLEPRVLYAERGNVETGDAALIPIGDAAVISEGDDVTIVGAGSSVQVIRQAVAVADWSAEVIDLQTLLPWDRQTVIDSVVKTGRLVIVEEGPYTGGWSSVVASEVAAEAFGDLEAPIVRVTAPDIPVPFAKSLEHRYLPHPEYVIDQVSQLLETGRKPDPWWIKEGRSA